MAGEWSFKNITQEILTSAFGHRLSERLGLKPREESADARRERRGEEAARRENARRLSAAFARIRGLRALFQRTEKRGKGEQFERLLLDVASNDTELARIAAMSDQQVNELIDLSRHTPVRDAFRAAVGWFGKGGLLLLLLLLIPIVVVVAAFKWIVFPVVRGLWEFFRSNTAAVATIAAMAGAAWLVCWFFGINRDHPAFWPVVVGFLILGLLSAFGRGGSKVVRAVVGGIVIVALLGAYLGYRKVTEFTGSRAAASTPTTTSPATTPKPIQVGRVVEGAGATAGNAVGKFFGGVFGNMRRSWNSAAPPSATPAATPDATAGQYRELGTFTVAPGQEAQVDLSDTNLTAYRFVSQDDRPFLLTTPRRRQYVYVPDEASVEGLQPGANYKVRGVNPQTGQLDLNGPLARDGVAVGYGTYLIAPFFQEEVTVTVLVR